MQVLKNQIFTLIKQYFNRHFHYLKHELPNYKELGYNNVQLALKLCLI